jgi:hypothetical protein
VPTRPRAKSASLYQPLARTDDGLGRPRCAAWRFDLARIQLGSHGAGRHACQFRENRRFGRRQLVKLFRGVKPTDLPVEQPSHIELVINLQTAKAIGHGGHLTTGLSSQITPVIER